MKQFAKVSDTALDILMARTLASGNSEERRPRNIHLGLAALAPSDYLSIVSAGTGAADFPDSSDLSTAILQAFSLLDTGHGHKAEFAARILETLGERLSQKAVEMLLGLIPPSELFLRPTIVDRALERFPQQPDVLRIAIRSELQNAQSVRLDALLNRLGSLDTSVGTAAFIQRSRRNARGSVTARIALVSSYTIDQLGPLLDFRARALGLTPEIYVAPFNSWAREVLDENAGLRSFGPDVVFLSIAIDDLAPRLAEYVPPEELSAIAEAAIDRVVSAARHFSGWAGATPLVVHSFHSAFPGPLGSLEGRDALPRAAWLSALNASLAGELRSLPSTYYLDVTTVANRAGASLHDNAKLRHIASMRLAPDVLGNVADEYMKYVAAAKRLTRKCVVVDLDNTLWGGVVGEDGKDGIRLGHTAPGSEFVEFQQFLRSLTARGIMLAVCSKNNPDDALEVIREHESMVLRESDFSAIRINWNPKPDNIASIAAELNIGVDSLVFVDDNPDEREQMRQLQPDVLTVELPKDPSLYRATLEALPQLQSLVTTSEDRARVASYQTARLRNEVKAAASNLDEYLESLDIVVDIESAKAAHVPRIAQLFARTNQFNVTTRRYDATQISEFIRDNGRRLWVLSSKDRFGDHGLVALALVRTSPKTWTIDSFLMSCRVIGYGIEGTLLAHVAKAAQAANASQLIGEFIPTTKNVPAKDLYARHGFERGVPHDTIEHWDLDLSDALLYPTWVKVTDHDA